MDLEANLGALVRGEAGPLAEKRRRSLQGGLMDGLDRARHPPRGPPALLAMASEIGLRGRFEVQNLPLGTWVELSFRHKHPRHSKLDTFTGR